MDKQFTVEVVVECEVGAIESSMQTLSDLQLCIVGGGIGDTVL